MDAIQNPEIKSEQSMSRKVVIVGAGDVGASFAYALLQSGTAESSKLLPFTKFASGVSINK